MAYRLRNSVQHARGIWTWIGSAFGGINAGIRPRRAGLRVLSAVVGLVATVALAPPAQAVKVTLVNNFGQEKHDVDRFVGELNGVRHSSAQSFTTGNNSTGYTIIDVACDINTEPDAGEDSGVKVSIYTANESGTPGDLLYALTNPSSIKTMINTFIAPDNATLESNTTYFVVFEATGSTDYELVTTESNSEDSGGAADWSFGDAQHIREDNGSWSLDTAENASLSLRIKGEVNPQQAQNDIWTATLNVAELQRSPPPRVFGYGLHPLGGNLSDDTFTYDGVEYTVTELWDSEGDGNGLILKLSPTGQNVFHKGQFKLHIGDTAYPFVSAIYDSPAAIFFWADANLSWSAGDMIAVKISSNPPNAFGVPTISGTAMVARLLTVSTAGIMDPDGLTSPTYTYQWIRVDADESNPVDISGATSSTYTPGHADAGKRLKVRVRFMDDESVDEELTSAASEVVVSNAADATGVPTILGAVMLGETLTVSTAGIMDPDGLTSPNFTYQWIRVDADESNPVDISGATSTTYTLVDADKGKRLKVRVRFVDDDGVVEELTSAASEVVVSNAADAPQNLKAFARARGQIALSWDEPADNGGREIIGYSIEVSTDGVNFTLLLITEQDARQYVHDPVFPPATPCTTVYRR